MINKNSDLSVDVLKVGHHGSRTSSTKEFLNKVNPKYTVISVGKGNIYGHPTEEALNRLKEKNVKVHRIDELGTVIAISNGENITFNCMHDNAINIAKPNIVKSSSNEKHSNSKISNNTSVVTNKNKDIKPTIYTGKYYVTKKGKFYHREGCRALAKSKHEITVDQALKIGYTPCQVCN